MGKTVGVLVGVLVTGAFASAQAFAHVSTLHGHAGQTFTFEVQDTGGTLDGATVYLAPAGLESWRTGVSVGNLVAGADGRSRLSFTWPAAYTHCVVLGDPATCSQRPFFPGLRVSISACSAPETSGDPSAGSEASSIVCAGGRAIVGPRPVAGQRVRLRHPLTGEVRWRNWGGAVARARGAIARDIVDCGGRLWYSTLEIRRRGTWTVTHGLAPCLAGESPFTGLLFLGSR